ncbi:hypothetical protein COR50_06345 [Chitinophaga caeni]|uniref:Uncharacterized protein n=1 Tax=Chitinophaga caeni TaxID=2029983 RepID=A0A291QS40_9BACT|nr:hypothetical protein [Chitinophaga caeni]ATL46829.1 hypothetical protein COR50_06345 [Chitinophaga caeni]
MVGIELDIAKYVEQLFSFQHLASNATVDDSQFYMPTIFVLSIILLLVISGMQFFIMIHLCRQEEEREYRNDQPGTIAKPGIRLIKWGTAIGCLLTVISMGFLVQPKTRHNISLEKNFCDKKASICAQAQQACGGKKAAS